MKITHPAASAMHVPAPARTSFENRHLITVLPPRTQGNGCPASARLSAHRPTRANPCIGKITGRKPLQPLACEPQAAAQAAQSLRLRKSSTFRVACPWGSRIKEEKRGRECLLAYALVRLGSQQHCLQKNGVRGKMGGVLSPLHTREG